MKAYFCLPILRYAPFGGLDWWNPLPLVVNGKPGNHGRNTKAIRAPIKPRVLSHRGRSIRARDGLRIPEAHLPMHFVLPCRWSNLYSELFVVFLAI